MRRLTFLFLILCLSVNCFALQKNVASQKWIVFAFDRTDNVPKTGDAAQITANLRIDGVQNAVDDTNPTELEDGFYEFDITAAESNGDNILITPASSTGDIQVIGAPMALWTTPPNIELLSIDASGRIDVAKWIGTAVTLSTGNKPDVNIDEISDDTAAPGNLELMYDGTGYIADTAPASRSQVDNIGAASGGAINFAPIHDNTIKDTIDNASADLKGGGLVGIPVTGHAFIAGNEVTIANTTSYNGAHTLVSVSARLLLRTLRMLRHSGVVKQSCHRLKPLLLLERLPPVLLQIRGRALQAPTALTM
jgi:hypothetical protein